MPSTIDLQQVANALPTLSAKAHAGLPSSNHRGNVSAVLPLAWPSCFQKVIERSESTLPIHRHQVATLQAIASAIPSDTARLGESGTTAAFLVALLSSLDRLVATTEPPQVLSSRASGAARASRKTSRRSRLQLVRDERDVAALAVNQLVAPETAVHDAMQQDEDAQDASAKAQAANPALTALASFASLIAMALQNASHAVVNRKAEHILTSILTAYHHASGYVSVAHHVNVVISTALSVLSASALSTPTVQTAFLYLVRHSVDAEEAFRRNSQRALLALVNAPAGPSVARITSPIVASFYVSQIQAYFRALRDENLTEVRQKEIVSALTLLLAGVETYAPFLSPTHCARVVVEIVFMAVSDMVQVAAVSHATLATVFGHRRDEGSDDANDDVPLLGENDFCKMLTTVLNHPLPEDCGDSLTVAYSSCVAAGVLGYVLYFEHVSPSDEFIILAVRRVFNTIDASRGATAITRQICRAFATFLQHRWFMHKPKVLALLLKFMGKKYRPVWGDVIPVLRKYLENGLCAGHDLMKESVKAFAEYVLDTRAKAWTEQDVKMREMADSVLKSISRGGGVSFILSACEVRYDEKAHVTNAWMLAVVRDNIVGAALAEFEIRILPIAEKLNTVMIEKQEQGRVIEAKNVEMYKMQMWALLPGFCNKPSDLLHEGVMTIAFKNIHSCLCCGDGNLESFGIAAFRQLSLSVSTLPVADPTCKTKIDAFSKRLKKLFPTLVEGVAKVSDGRRADLLKAITMGCKATNDTSLISGLLRKNIRLILELQVEATGGTEDTKQKAMSDLEKTEISRKIHSSADIAIAIVECGLVPSGSAEIKYLEKAMMPFFEDRKESSLQKKAYRVSSMFITSGVITKDFEQFLTFVKNTSEAHKTLAAGAKGARLGWITAVVNQHRDRADQAERILFLQMVNELFLSEVILSTRDASEKSRAAAFDCLLNMARAWHSLKDGEGVGGLQQFFLCVAAGLGGKSSAMLAGAISSLGKLLESFRFEVEGDEELRGVVDSLFTSIVKVDSDDSMIDDAGERGSGEGAQAGPIGILLRHEAVEVQRAALGVVKVATKCCRVPEGRLLRLVPGILPGLLHVSAGSKKQETRLKVRLVLERLLRKCGAENLEALFPSEHKKLLTAVRKQFMRDLAKKQANRERKFSSRQEGLRGSNGGDNGMRDGDEESDDSDVEADLVDGEGRDSDGEAGSKNNGMNDVVDLLESKAGLALVGGRNLKKKETVCASKKKKDVGKAIRYTDNGKPIFVESDDESAGAEAGSVAGDEDDDGSDSDDGKKGMRKAVDGREVGGKRRFGQVDGGRVRDGVKKVKGSFGEEFRGRRGAGDVKRAGRPDPFAYVPLGASMFSAGSRPGAGGKGSRDSALSRLHGKQGVRRKGRGGRSGVPGRR